MCSQANVPDRTHAASRTVRYRVSAAINQATPSAKWVGVSPAQTTPVTSWTVGSTKPSTG